jgi:HD superfamily phosphohydrolase
LISSQLDLDRLDYLSRDSFFTGVSEGRIGINRILKTMRVHKGNIVIEKKGIYAIENYIIARRLMYMQVYLHKTVLSADALIRSVFRRVRDLLDSGYELDFASNSLRFFMQDQPSAKKQITKKVLQAYTQLDDYDIYLNIKFWTQSDDKILSELCSRFLNRSLFRTTFFDHEPNDINREEIHKQTKIALKKLGLPYGDEAASYFYSFDQSYTEAYKYKNESIWILDDENAIEFSKAADTKNIIALTVPVVKNYCVHLKDFKI